MNAPRRKYARSSAGSSSDDIQTPSSPTEHAYEKQRRSGACVHCKSLKVRCVYSPGSLNCQRCKTSGINCEERQRKKRKQAPTHDALQQRAYEKDVEIERLLNALDKRAADARLERVLEHAKSDITHLSQVSSPYSGAHWPPHVTAEDAVVTTYATSRPSSDHRIPDIVRYCSLFPQDIVALFDVYFDKINPFFAVLDPNYHTPHNLVWTSPFLFTVICATAAKHFQMKPLRSAALAFALDLASTVTLDTTVVSVDTVQAFMILSVYAAPGKQQEDSRSSVFMGVAMRMALRLQLNMPPPIGCDEQESVNRTRTWLTCLCMDSAVATRQGKAPTIGYDTAVSVQSREFYRSSAFNLPYDVHMCAYVQLALIVGGFYAKIEGGKEQQKFDLAYEASFTESQLSNEQVYWSRIYQEEYASDSLRQDCAIGIYRGLSTELIACYLRLIVLAKGFQESIKNGQQLDATSEKLLVQSMDAARTAITTVTQRLAPMRYFAYATESNFLYASFCAAYLLKLLAPRFTGMLRPEEKEDIIQTVGSLTEVLLSQGGDSANSYGHLLQRLLSNLTDVTESQWSSTATHYSQGSDHQSFGVQPIWNPNFEQGPTNETAVMGFQEGFEHVETAPRGAQYQLQDQEQAMLGGLDVSLDNNFGHFMVQECLTDFQQFYRRPSPSTPSSGGFSDFGWRSSTSSTTWSQASAPSSVTNGWK